MLGWQDISNLRIFKSLRLKQGAVITIENLNGTTTDMTATELQKIEGNLGRQAAPAAKTTSTTLTAAELLGRLITGNQGAAGAAAYTLPLATDLETALLAAHPGLANDDSFDFSVINISTNALEIITMTTNTGWTLVGDMTIAPVIAGDQSSGTLRARRTAANTYSLYRT